LVERYHSIVFFNPSSKGIFALKPNYLSALDVTSILLGWPPGFDKLLKNKTSYRP
jgi:hypothetical protein